MAHSMNDVTAFFSQSYAEARAKLETLIKQAPNSDGAVIAKEILAGIATKP